MAYENVQFQYPNFTIGPIFGNFCSIDTSGATHNLVIKNAAGSLLYTFSLSSNLTNTLISIEYVGPINLSANPNGATFFTVERVSDSSCLIKRWTLNTGILELSLVETQTKTSSGSNYYDVYSAAVEHYRRTFSLHNPGGVNYVDVSSTFGINTGTRLFLGPSNDSDNMGAVEEVVVDYVGTYGGLPRVYLTSSLTYQYVIGDSVCYPSYMYLISRKGPGGVSTIGTIFKLNCSGWSVVSTDTDKVYLNIDTTKWHPVSSSIASVLDNNLLFISPYSSYYNWKSMFLNNVESDNVVNYTVYDLVFDGLSVYKLTDRTTKRDDEGTKTTYTWSNYSYEADTISPYSNNLLVYTDTPILIGGGQSVVLTAVVRDQFNVGLQGLTIYFIKDSGDPGWYFTPLDGQAVTDINGVATISGTFGTTYEGPTIIDAKVSGGSPYTGSEWVWGSTKLLTFLNSSSDINLTSFSGYTDGKQIMQIAPNFISENNFVSKSKFSHPGGDWVDAYPPVSDSFIVKQILSFVGELLEPQIPAFISEVNSSQITAEYNMHLSQLNMSKHTYIVDGVDSPYLFTYSEMNQFVFVVDATPAFWSEKNPQDTDIWIRIRPPAFTLDISTVKFYVKEVSYAGDTGFVDVSDSLDKVVYDAGGGIYGLEITYTPPVIFKHSATIYVRIEVYDTAVPEPNFIYVEYWFLIIPDYSAPYLENLSPGREEANVAVDSTIYFEIKDNGAGVDIDTLEIHINSLLARSENITYEMVTSSHYKVTYTPPTDLYFDKSVRVNVKVADISPNVNWLNDSYTFYSHPSSGVWFTGYGGLQCVRSVSRFANVGFLVLSNGNGIDLTTLKVEVNDRDITTLITTSPVIYRIS